MGKWMMLWGGVEKNKKKFAWGQPNRRSALRGGGGTLASCLPCHLSEVYPRPFVYVMNVTQRNKNTHKPLRSSNRSSKSYILIVKYT